MSEVSCPRTQHSDLPRTRSVIIQSRIWPAKPKATTSHRLQIDPPPKKTCFNVFVLMGLVNMHILCFPLTFLYSVLFLHQQIDGQTNPKLQSIFLERFPIHTAHFSTNGEQVILASQRRLFYVYDMIKGEVIKIPQIRGIISVCATISVLILAWRN